MSNPVNIAKESLPTGFMAGNGTVGVSEEVIDALAFPIQKHIVIRADSDNGGDIIVGRPGAAVSGFILHAGETSPPIYVDDTSKVAVVGSEADQDYSWIAN